MRLRKLSVLAGIVCLVACDSSEQSPTITVRDIEPSSATPSVQPTVPEKAPEEAVPPNFSDREGDRYFYASAVSEEDEKRGKATGDIVTFRYRGKIDGLHVLEHLSEAGQIYSRAECATPCRVIKRTSGNGTVDRLPFSPTSVIGSAFEDAIAGRLSASKVEVGKTASRSSMPNSTAQIPVQFRGEWRQDLMMCGVDTDETILIVGSGGLAFWESEGLIDSVSVNSPTSITVSGRFSGEGHTWEDRVSLNLSSTGEELTVGDFKRSRCPS